jgi:hypothetical protein
MATQKSEDLVCESEKVFSDFKNYELKCVMFLGLFTFDVEKAGEELQMELIYVDCDTILKQKFCEIGVPNFYSFVPRGRFQRTVEFAYKILCAMLGSMYVCKQLFSLMKRNKTYKRSQPMDMHLSLIMVISARFKTRDLHPFRK